MAIISSTRDPRKLYREAWTLLKRALLLRIEASDGRYGQVFGPPRGHRAPGHAPPGLAGRRRALRARRLGARVGARHGGDADARAADVAALVAPYYVPHFAADGAVSAATKRHR